MIEAKEFIDLITTEQMITMLCVGLNAIDRPLIKDGKMFFLTDECDRALNRINEFCNNYPL